MTTTEVLLTKASKGDQVDSTAFRINYCTADSSLENYLSSIPFNLMPKHSDINKKICFVFNLSKKDDSIGINCSNQKQKNAPTDKVHI